nr:type II secretion system protein GspG [Corallococcus silvisoli]
MTLIEIMVVITILGLIAAAVGVAVIGQLGTAKQQRVTMDFGALGAPSSSTRYRRAGCRTRDCALVEQRILPALPLDPWGNDSMYTLDKGGPAIVSLGADGAPGGDGDDRDLSSLDRDARSER